MGNWKLKNAKCKVKSAKSPSERKIIHRLGSLNLATGSIYSALASYICHLPSAITPTPDPLTSDPFPP